MNYISNKELDKLLLENEAQHLHFEKMSIVYNYALEDNKGNHINQSKVQDAYKFKIDGKDMVVSIDRYKDYAPMNMLISINAPEILEIKKSEAQIYSVNKEYDRVSEIIQKSLGGWINGRETAKAFNQNEELNTEFAKRLEDLRTEHMAVFKHIFVENISEIIQSKKLTTETHDVLDKLRDNFEKAVKEIRQPLDEIYSSKVASERKNALESYRVRQEQQDLDNKITSDLKKLVAFNEVKDSSLEKFGYYAKIEVAESNITVKFLDKDNKSLDILALPLISKEIDFYSKETGEAEYLRIRIIDDQAFKEIDKITHKKYYHALYDLKSSIILNDKHDIAHFDYIVNNNFDDIPQNKDEIIFANDSNALAKIMKVNNSNEVRLNLVNSEKEKDFPTRSTKLKI